MSRVRLYGEKSKKSRGGAILLSLTVVINRWVETEREAIGMLRRHAYRSSEFSGWYFAIIRMRQCWHRDFADRKRDLPTTSRDYHKSEYIRVSPWDPREQLLLLVNSAIEKRSMWGGCQTRGRGLPSGTSRVGRLFKCTWPALKRRVYLDSHSPGIPSPSVNTVTDHSRVKPLWTWISEHILRWKLCRSGQKC